MENDAREEPGMWRKGKLSCPRALCFIHNLQRTQGPAVRGTRTEPGCQSPTAHCIHTLTHTHRPFCTQLKGSYRPHCHHRRGQPLPKEVAETAFHFRCYVFQKNQSLISVLNKPLRALYSDFLLTTDNRSLSVTGCDKESLLPAYSHSHFPSRSDSPLRLPASLLVTSFHPVHRPRA